MSSTNFINQQTVIQADWLNDINGVNYNLLGTGTAVPTTKAGLMTNLGALNRANNLSDVVSASAARVNIGVTATGSDTTYLFRANNLSDLGSVSTARTNLGVTATGADTTYLFRANNLSDLASVSTARTNLGLGSAALLTAGTSANNAVQLDGSAKLPAVDGSQLTNLPGSLTLLGTITVATSGVLSGLTLTSYKQLYIVLNGVSGTGTTGNLTLLDPNSTSINICPMPGSAANGIAGIVLIDLATGVINLNANDSSSTTLPTYKTNGVVGAGKTTFSTSATSLTFGVSTGSFDAGTILVYGVK